MVLADWLKCDLKDLSAHTLLCEGGLNELNQVKLLLALEKEFGFSISNEDGAMLNTADIIVNYVERWADEDTADSFEQGARRITKE